MSSRTINMSKQQILKLKETLKNSEIRKTPPYALYQFKTSECVITAYESGKVVFQGNGADFYANAYENDSPIKKASNTKEIYPQCGSDEVGTGDYFGPVCVCACCVQKEDVSFLRELKIQDSKAIQDEYIREIAPKLMKRLTYSLLIMDNVTYNRVHPTNNMVAIKSKLHNQAFVHLRKKLQGLPEFCIIDQFVQKNSYYRYVANEKEVVRDIHFETKAENKYLSVACGSIIARYAFLLAFDDMEERYNFHFLKGAGNKVDANIREFVKQHGKEELNKVAKLHFANTKKAFM